MAEERSAQGPARTGIAGLDEVLAGGFPRNRLYLLEGNPGSGKTTTALQFLLEGRQAGEAGLYVTLSETAEELRAVAEGHGWSLDGITIYELPATEEGGDYTLFHPSEVELNKTTRGVLSVVEATKPSRVVFDSLSEMRLLARDPLRYRRQILALKQYFVGRACTVLLLDDRTGEVGDLQLESIVHGVIDLQQLAPEYGGERRRLLVRKMRGLQYRGGYHDVRIVRGGVLVFPRLVASHHRVEFEPGLVSSGVGELDQLLGGGIDRGSSLLASGPAGTGKSSLAVRYAISACERGEHAAVFAFDEGLATLATRVRGLGWTMDGHLASGRLVVQQVDPAELSPGELAGRIRQVVETQAARVVVIDSLNGYLHANPDERHLALHLHELISYLRERGVVTILVMAQTGLVGGAMDNPVDVSYLADTVILLRYFESHGALRVAASVMKKRSGNHERTIREMQVGEGGIRLGPPLAEFRGVLSGVPVHSGAPESLLRAPGGPGQPA